MLIKNENYSRENRLVSDDKSRQEKADIIIRSKSDDNPRKFRNIYFYRKENTFISEEKKDLRYIVSRKI